MKTKVIILGVHRQNLVKGDRHVMIKFNEVL